MQNKIKVILSTILLVLGCVDGFARDSRSSGQEQSDQLINTLWTLRYGEWGSLSEDFKEIGDPVIEPLRKMLRNKETSGWSQYKIEWHQRRIAWALGKTPSDKAVKSLHTAQKDPDEEVRMRAKEALKVVEND